MIVHVQYRYRYSTVRHVRMYSCTQVKSGLEGGDGTFWRMEEIETLIATGRKMTVGCFRKMTVGVFQEMTRGGV